MTQPGPPSISIWGEQLPLDEAHFIPDRNPEHPDMEALAQLARLPQLRSVSLYDIPIDDRGLALICACPGIDDMVLQNTAITDAGLRHLARLPALTHLRLKDNHQLSDACAVHLAAATRLENLQLHETSVGARGLAQLVELPALRDLIVTLHHERLTHAQLLELSARMPECEILVKGRGVYRGGVPPAART